MMELAIETFCRAKQVPDALQVELCHTLLLELVSFSQIL
jgi:hypothetical protein